MAMQMLPENEWGNVVKNYTQLYGNIGNYTNQLKALEKARDAKTDDPADSVPAGLSLRLPGLSQAGRARTGQGPGFAAQGSGLAEAARHVCGASRFARSGSYGQPKQARARHRRLLAHRRRAPPAPPPAGSPSLTGLIPMLDVSQSRTMCFLDREHWCFFLAHAREA